MSKALSPTVLSVLSHCSILVDTTPYASVCKRDTGDMLSWFDLSYMKANPGKFQFILFGNYNNGTLTLLPCVKLKSLQVLLEYKLIIQFKFDENVSVLCSKASRQINVLARFSKTLDQKGKLKKNVIVYFRLL